MINASYILACSGGRDNRSSCCRLWRSGIDDSCVDLIGSIPAPHVFFNGIDDERARLETTLINLYKRWWICVVYSFDLSPSTQ